MNTAYAQMAPGGNGRDCEFRKHRCLKCGRVLFLGWISRNSFIEIKCPRCGEKSLFDKRKTFIAKQSG